MSKADRIREALTAGPLTLSQLEEHLKTKCAGICAYLGTKGELKFADGKWHATGKVKELKRGTRGGGQARPGQKLRRKRRKVSVAPRARSSSTLNGTAAAFMAAADLLHLVVLEHVEAEGVPVLQAAIANFEAAKALQEALA